MSIVANIVDLEDSTLVPYIITNAPYLLTTWLSPFYSEPKTTLSHDVPT